MSKLGVTSNKTYQCQNTLKFRAVYLFIRNQNRLITKEVDHELGG